MMIEEKISSRTTVAATVSPVSSPDVDMNETEAPDGQDNFSIGKEKVHAEALISMERDENNNVQNEILPPMKTVPLSDRVLRKRNDQENVVGDAVAPVNNDASTGTAVHQIPSNCPNGSTHSTGTGNDQTLPMDNNDEKNDRALVANDDGQVNSSDQPVMDGIFQVLKI